MKKHLLPAAPLLAAASAAAGEMSLTIEVPRLDVAQYHRPYIAAWIEKPDRSVAVNLAVWYDVGQGDAKGETWLKDMRQWWRKSGRSLKMPADGVSGPTRPAGTHTLTIPPAISASLTPLADGGEYTLVVEAAREVGGREMLRLPFKWDGNQSVEATAKGESELGQIKLILKP